MAVDAASFASAKLIEDGFWWKFEAVWKAFCFCAQVVPPEGVFPDAVGEVGLEVWVEEALVVMREKRDCISDI